MIDITQIKPNSAPALAGSDGTKSGWITVGAGLSLSHDNVLSTTAVTSPLKPEAELLQGTIDGANKIFTISNPPVANSQVIYLNGVALWSAAGEYTILSNTITFNTAPVPGDILVAQYWH